MDENYSSTIFSISVSSLFTQPDENQILIKKGIETDIDDATDSD